MQTIHYMEFDGIKHINRLKSFKRGVKQTTLSDPLNLPKGESFGSSCRPTWHLQQRNIKVKKVTKKNLHVGTLTLHYETQNQTNKLSLRYIMSVAIEIITN